MKALEVQLAGIETEILLTKQKLQEMGLAENNGQTEEFEDLEETESQGNLEGAGECQLPQTVSAESLITMLLFIAHTTNMEIEEDNSAETADKDKASNQSNEADDIRPRLRLLAQELRKLKAKMAELRDELRSATHYLRLIRLTKASTGGHAQYEVAEVVDSKLDHHSVSCPIRYKVRWAGFEGTGEEYSWVSPFELGSATQAVADFHAANPYKPRMRITSPEALPSFSWR